MPINCYHGTIDSTAQHLANGAIDVTKGGGELGMGFYTGEYLWIAKSWAANRHGVNGAVVMIEVQDTDFFGLAPLLLTRTDALAHRNKIKRNAATRVYVFNENVVWSPIVGTTRIDAEQYKFESLISEALINGAEVVRKVI